MALKAVVDSLDSVPEEVRALYVPGGDNAKGKFVLDVEGADGFALEHVEGLRNAFATVKAEHEKGVKALEAYKGLPAASTLRDKLKKLEKLEQFDPEGEADKLAKARSTAALEELASKHAAEKEALTGDNSRLWTALNRALIESAARDAISKENGSAALLMPHIMSRAKVDRDTLAVQIVRDDGTPSYNTKGSPSTIEDLVGELKKHADFGRAFEATASGSGASAVRQTGSGAPQSNPWAKGSFNLTEQMKLKKADPNRAAHLEALAKAQR